MTVEKKKHQHTLPDRRLALAFKFSAEDLAANRNGYITRAQAWFIPLRLRGLFHFLGERSLSKNPSRRQQVATICGRAVLGYEQQQIQSLFHADFVEIYKLGINQLQFRLTPEQHQAIGDGVIYRLYYDPQTIQILSLERAIKGCSES